MSTRRLSLPVEDPRVAQVTATLHQPESPAGPPVLLTHGAGGDLDAAGLVALADVLAAAGATVLRANLPYREAGRRAAPRASASVTPLFEVWKGADAWLRENGYLTGPADWVLGGKSYGGRVASLLAAGEGQHTDLPATLGLAGLLFYGYPLHPPGKPDKLRVAHWPAVPVPCLFLQGDRDTFCEQPLLEEHVHKLPRRATLEIVSGGDHSLHVSRAASPDGTARNPVKVIHSLDEPIRRWLASLRQ